MLFQQTCEQKSGLRGIFDWTVFQTIVKQNFLCIQNFAAAEIKRVR